MQNDIKSTISIPQPETIVKPVAIYCRVSTENQEVDGTSLETQREACLKYCQERGYQVTHQFIETASGLTLQRPKLDKLRQLVRNEDIKGVVIHCLDRISRDPTHGVILTQELEKHNVTLEAVTEDIDSSELGKLITYIRQYAANLEAEKIRERTGRGIRSRVFDKKMPVTFRAPYGYEWDRENRRLLPNGDYETAKLIITLAIDGKSYDYIIAELKRRHIPSPGGLPEWNKHTISSVIRNPVYAGQYYAFKSEAVKPVKPNGNRYGRVKSSVKRLPQDKWHHIPEIEVVNPPMTLDQRALLLDQLKLRQNTAKRNAKRDYLLRGRVLCATHQGKNGEMRVFHGQPHHARWRYTCPLGGCDTPNIPGPELEHLVAYLVYGGLYLTFDDDWKSLENAGSTRDILHDELKKVQDADAKLIEKQANIEDERLSGKFDDHPEVFTTLNKRYQNGRTQNKKRQDEILEQLANLEYQDQAKDSIEKIRAEYVEFFKSVMEAMDPTKPKGLERMPELIYFWNEIYNRLNLKIIVHPANVRPHRGIIKPKIGRKRYTLEIKGMLPLSRMFDLDAIELPTTGPG